MSHTGHLACLLAQIIDPGRGRDAGGRRPHQVYPGCYAIERRRAGNYRLRALKDILINGLAFAAGFNLK